MSRLFSELKLRGIRFKNRVFVSPMCQYSSQDGLPNDWHLVHLGSRAVGGAGLVVAEATAVSREGRITPSDLGIWSDDHVEGLARVTKFIREQGSVPGIQLAHAGRKASTAPPWEGGGAVGASQGGWQTVAPSAVPFGEGYPAPRELSAEGIARVVEDFRQAVIRSREAGFQVVELHMAHGYLLHQFLSPLSNRRSDSYGGDLAGRMRLPLEVARAARELWPDDYPLFVRISATDWCEGGWDLAQSVELCRRLKDLGVDLVDCSTGGLLPNAKIPVGPGYQLPFSEGIRREAGIATGAVGMITNAQQAEEVIAQGKADAVFLARELLRRPYWPLHAAHALGVKLPWPKQYERGRLRAMD